MRAKAREVAFQIVFASRFGEAEKGLKTAMYKNLNKDDVEYCERVLSLVEEHETDFTQILDERSRAFPESRLSPRIKVFF